MPNEKTPLTSRSRRRSKDWYLSCVLSIGTCLGFLLWFVFAQDRGQVLKQPLLAATPQTDTPEHEMTAEDILPVGLSQEFSLKHIFHHGSGKYNRVHRRLDITPKFLEQYSDQLETPLTPDEVKESSLHDAVSSMDWPNSMRDENPWTVSLHVRERARRAKVTRLAERHTPNFLDSYLEYARSVKGNPARLNAIGLEWDPETDIRVPDVNDRNTLVSLALVSSNAYVRLPQNDDDKKNSDWIDVGDPWSPEDEHDDLNFGWLENGLRGHIFVSNDSKTVIIGIKGTSGAGLPGGGSDETMANDKTNDNLLFSCCCARVSYLWTTVCDCYEKTYTCNQDCLERELLRQDRYYQATLDLYRNVTKLYPPETTDIWVTGHSLGGALASLLGRTYGLPVVAFEAPGEMLATKRLHLPQAPGIPKHLEHIWHIGNTADPIFMGVCNGASSSCSMAGYAMETTCHTGQICVYDVVTDKGWHVNLLNHRIHTVIDDIILAYNETAPCVEQPPCRDCFNWRFTSHDDSEPDKPSLPNPLKPRPTTSSTTEKTQANTLSSSNIGQSTKTQTSSKSGSPPKPTETEKPQKCLKRTWYGWCSEWGDDE
ncbi:putative lipase [Clavispora lusitaniae]|uniref:Lipase n=1 Tax=Clavispora lusitaniae TaxID=36911 RepID=A0ACD0WN24_CLALS|nr:putative lipase [Clavispora lusitaniae]QFZ34338.1 putative lipase [Clavispora lusitaniae]QFZ40022.1 putative lipase [Clavispora lusitaniae]QFZ45704.1 putative lipase [Clavispora lusitaniae]QFZ51368.1 putative lipase [Clavispora lusitaniae]